MPYEKDQAIIGYVTVKKPSAIDLARILKAQKSSSDRKIEIHHKFPNRPEERTTIDLQDTNKVDMLLEMANDVVSQDADEKTDMLLAMVNDPSPEGNLVRGKAIVYRSSRR